MMSIAERRQIFRALHERRCFSIPNPWDIGSARYLEYLGFKALATTSAGFAFSRGLPDGAVPLDMMLAHISELVHSVELPINADFEHGYADNPSELAQNVTRCAETEVAGLSIEDSTGRVEQPLYEIPHGADRIAAAKEALTGTNVVLVGRAECFLVGRNDIDDVISRLVAYADAGADCLYAPGVSRREDIVAIVKAIAPKPVNLLIGSAGGLQLADAAALGVRRVSVGGALARAAWGGLIRAATKLANEGSFDAFAEAAPHTELQAFFTGFSDRSDVLDETSPA